MKTLKFLLLAVLLGFNLVSCDPPTLQEEVGVENVEVEEINSFLNEDEEQEVKPDN